MEDRIYRCTFCGAEFTSKKDRDECEAKCYKEEQERKAAEQRKKEAKKERQERIELMIDQQNDLIDTIEKEIGEFCDDYGTFRTSKSMKRCKYSTPVWW